MDPSAHTEGHAAGPLPPFFTVHLTLHPDYLSFNRQNALGHTLNALAPCALDRAL